MGFPIPTEKIESRHYINGEFSESSDKGTFKVLSPYSHEKIVDACEASVDDTNRAVAAAKAAFPAWSNLDPNTRGSYLKKMSALIVRDANELAQLDAMAMGRPVSSYFDAMYAASLFEHYSQAGYDAKGTTSLNTPGFVNMTFRQPIGPVAVVSRSIKDVYRRNTLMLTPTKTDYSMERASDHVRYESFRCTGSRMHSRAKEQREGASLRKQKPIPNRTVAGDRA